jgi:hypothetical protein
MAVTVKNGVFWDAMLCGSCKNLHFGGTSVLNIATQHHIPDESIFQESLLLAKWAVGTCCYHISR